MARKDRGVASHGVNIRARRRSLALTQEQLAEIAGCDVKTIRNAELDRKLDAATLQRISEALGCDLWDIIVPQPLVVEQSLQQLIGSWIHWMQLRDVEGVKACYHGCCELWHPEGTHGLPHGRFCGLNAIGKFLDELFAVVEEFSLGETAAMDWALNAVLLRAEQSYRLPQASEAFRFPVVHEFTFRDGAIYRHLILIGPEIGGQSELPWSG